MSQQTTVQLEDLCLDLVAPVGQLSILKKINFSVAEGEVVGIVGPSGSGKTSMLMVASGLEAITAGKALIMGQDLGAMSEDELAVFRRDNIGIVFQSFHLLSSMTALENVAVPLELAGSEDAHKLAQDALEKVGLGARITHYPGQLSGGEQQRVALARAFASNPNLILADEPTGNLDTDTGEQVIALLFALSKAQNTTLLLITHDPALAVRCDRVVRMSDGQLSELDKDELLRGERS
ncbi:MAG: ABC transporter ATP-binding protein [Pseudomonadota bacterium]